MEHILRPSSSQVEDCLGRIASSVLSQMTAQHEMILRVLNREQMGETFVKQSLEHGPGRYSICKVSTASLSMRLGSIVRTSLLAPVVN